MFQMTRLFCLMLVCSSVAWSWGAEVVPPRQSPRDQFVTVKHSGACWVIGMVNGKFVNVYAQTFTGQSSERWLVFNGPPGSYLIYGIENDQPFQFVFEILATPGPDPDPDPDPGSFGMVEVSREASRWIEANGRQLMAKIGGNFTSTASAVASGSIKTIEAAREQVTQKNRTDLGALEVAWRPFLYDVGDAVDQLIKDGKVTTVKQYGVVLREIGEGLSNAQR